MRRFLTFDLLPYLSDRDFAQIIERADKTTILRAYKDVPSKHLNQIFRVLTDQSNEHFAIDLDSLGVVSDADVLAARDRMAEIADRMLAAGDMEDWRLRRA